MIPNFLNLVLSEFSYVHIERVKLVVRLRGPLISWFVILRLPLTSDRWSSNICRFQMYLVWNLQCILLKHATRFHMIDKYRP